MDHHTHLSVEAPEESSATKLDEIADAVERAQDNRMVPDYYLLHYRTKTLLPRLQGPRILELGCAEGGMTLVLKDRAEEIVCVEGSAKLLAKARERVVDANVTLHCSTFEDFKPQGVFSSIIMSHILEHLADPRRLLAKAKEWLSPQGGIHVLVPNAGALNRRIGRAMGMLNRLDELHERDRLIGHLRVYSRDSLAADIEAAGLEVVHWGGVFLKPLSDAQMKNWDQKLLDAFFEMGKELPEYCAEIYAECRSKR
jgi:SAM-dependent methyltransferase